MNVPTLHVVASVLAWMSATINPFIYAFKNRQYQQAFKKVPIFTIVFPLFVGGGGVQRKIVQIHSFLIWFFYSQYLQSKILNTSSSCVVATSLLEADLETERPPARPVGCLTPELHNPKLSLQKWFITKITR